MTQSELGEIIRDRRKQLNLSQRQLGLDTDLAHSYISKIESATSDYPPSEQAIKLIADALKLERYPLLLHAGHIPKSIKPLVCKFLLIAGTAAKAQEILENAIANQPAK